MLLVNALSDRTVVEQIHTATRIDHDHWADLVASKLDVKLHKIEKEIAEKDMQISELEKVVIVPEKIDAQEQYMRRTSVQISGNPEEVIENVAQKSKELLNSPDFNLPLTGFIELG